jgi:hypothetical protein
MLSLRRVFAPAPPAEGADQVTQWRWVRAAQLRQLYIVVPLFVFVVALGLPVLLLTLAAVGLFAGIANALYLTLKIRRAESAADTG